MGTIARTMSSVDEVKQQMTQQLQQQQLQTIVQVPSRTTPRSPSTDQAMSNLCFKKCVETPGSRLSSSEQRCLSQCTDRFMDTMMAVQESFVAQAQQQQGSSSSFN